MKRSTWCLWAAAAARRAVLLRYVPHGRRVPARLDRARLGDRQTTWCSSSARSPPGWPPGRASREGRRKTADLVATTARPAWARQASRWRGTLFWLLLAFLAGVAVIYIQTALQATWGGPPLWPVAVGVVAVVTCRRDRVHRGRAVPRAVHRPAGRDRHLRPHQVGFHAALGSRARRAPTRCCRRPPRCPSATPASSTTSRRTWRSRRSCSWAGSRSRCSACSAWPALRPRRVPRARCAARQPHR